MSSQGLNATYRNSNAAYRYSPPGNTGPGVPGAGIPLGIYATQFASDNTKRIKEALLYREYNGTAVASGFTVPVDFRIVQSNENRKTYQFGEVVCTGCTGGFPFNPLGT
jgi:hypothetical protein